MYRRSIPLIMAFAMTLSYPHLSFAEESAHAPRILSIGAGMRWSPSPYKDYDKKALPFPIVFYEGQKFVFRGALVGLKLWTPGNSELMLTVSPAAYRFRRDDTSDAALKALSNRDLSGLAGFAWQSKGTWGQLQTSVQQEVTDHGGGRMASLNYGYSLTRGNLTITPSLGAVYTSSMLNDYYFGVSVQEATRSGLKAYSPKSGISPFGTLSASFRLTTKWVLMTTASYSELSDAVSDSPMVSGDSTTSYFLGISYIL